MAPLNFVDFVDIVDTSKINNRCGLSGERHKGYAGTQRAMLERKGLCWNAKGYAGTQRVKLKSAKIFLLVTTNSPNVWLGSYC